MRLRFQLYFSVSHRLLTDTVCGRLRGAEVFAFDWSFETLVTISPHTSARASGVWPGVRGITLRFFFNNKAATQQGRGICSLCDSAKSDLERRLLRLLELRATVPKLAMARRTHLPVTRRVRG